MSFKRQRGGDGRDIVESFAELLRQSTSRAMERLRQFYGRGSSTAGREPKRNALDRTAVRAVKPIDRLIILFCMHYFHVSDVVPPHHFLIAAQDLVAKSEERVSRASRSFFDPLHSSLAVYCETLVAESSASEMELCVSEMEEFVLVRERIGEFIVENGGGVDSLRAQEWPRNDAGGAADEMDGGDEAEEGEGDDTTGFAIAGRSGHTRMDLLCRLYQSLEFFSCICVFIHALSRDAACSAATRDTERPHGAGLERLAASGSSAPGHPARDTVVFQPRYERELLHLLVECTGARRGGTVSKGGVAGQVDAQPSTTEAKSAVEALKPTSTHVKLEVNEDDDEDGGGGGASSLARRGDPTNELVQLDAIQVAGSPVVKNEAEGEEEGEEEATEMMGRMGAKVKDELQEATATALVADFLALSHLPLPDGGKGTKSSPRVVSAAALEKVKGFYPPYYQLVHARLAVIVARQKLHEFAKHCTHPPPAITPRQQQVMALEEEELRRHQEMTLQARGGIGGLPLNYVPDQAYYQQLMGATADAGEPAAELGEDEELFAGEVMDYYLRPRAISNINETARQQQGNRPRNNNNSNNNNRSGPASPTGEDTTLVKPERFCKVKTGFTWTQYNRTHYDSRTNPPPKTVMWYDFTLLYPALAKTRRDPRTFFRIEDTPNGKHDAFCLLVFSVGPPYADVAYRIERKQWDTRPGGTRISFDSNGKFRLFFRFSNSNYRR